ncbi:MAG: N-succinylarginine dihydrolase, partial [Planctomycetota bacterium]
MSAREFNFDGLVGPTHNYSGLSYGNVASTLHGSSVSSPRAAALQGLEKMRTVAEMGIGQAVLPPVHRPRLEFLRQSGFQGTAAEIIAQAFREEPVLLAAAYSASSMWTANAATVSPSADCSDGRLHLSPANLSSTLHRSLEPPSTTTILRSIFNSKEHFVVHDPLLATTALADEGAANHTRLAPEHDGIGIETFVYGRAVMQKGTT